MSKRTVFTTITPLPAGVSREVVLDTLHDHLAMIDLNPAHDERHKMLKPPPEATPEEYHTTWYEITDKISYFPGYKGKVSFKACFHDLTNGLQTHCYAPMGLDLKEKWTLCGNLPHEPSQPAEIGIGAPISGLYLREDVEMKCNFLMTRFVRKTLKDCLAALVARMVVKSQIEEAAAVNRRLTFMAIPPQIGSPPGSPGLSGTPPRSPPLTAPLPGQGGMGMQLPPYHQGGYMGHNPRDEKSARASYTYGEQNKTHPYYQHVEPYDPSHYNQRPPQGQGVVGHHRVISASGSGSTSPNSPPPHVSEMDDTQRRDRPAVTQEHVAELPS